MLFSLFTVLAVTYLIVCTVGFVLARITIENEAMRKLFVLLGILVPPIALWALIKTILGHAKPVPYNSDLARIEDEIESERVAIFGGKPLSRSLSEAWEVAYLRYLAKAATRVESLVGSHDPGVSIFTEAK